MQLGGYFSIDTHTPGTRQVTLPSKIAVRFFNYMYRH